ncbi:hypothetical protein C1646_674627 [Rhizophagus diaphanus]|nr:hypothetical protein C1646_674627 [Rhizophagus diaphanus] [Rhizophagus sp. MUCL 43196]
MKLFNKLVRMLEIIFYLISFQINVINCQQYVPMKRAFHTATLVEKKIYFLGGFTELSIYTNDFFTLDVSKSFNQSEGCPFEDLNHLSASVVPEHNRATTSVGGISKDTFFLFGGDMGSQSKYASEVLQSFNTSKQVWQYVTINSGEEPLRRTSMNAVTDNNGKVYLYGGVKELVPIQYFNTMDTFDTVNKIWFSIDYDITLTPRDGYTATYIPDSGVIIYIGGFGRNFYPYITSGLLDMGNIDIYDTVRNNWRKQPTKNPPKSRVFHTAILTNDKRIIIFGGADNTTKHPAETYYEVLDVNTYQWYHSNKDIYIRAPYKGHTATLVGDHMLIAFGFVYTKEGNVLSDEILIYKIGDYADFDQVENLSQSPSEPPATEPPATESSPQDTKHIKLVIIIAIVSSILGFIIIIIAAFIIYKRYKKHVKSILFIE